METNPASSSSWGKRSLPRGSGQGLSWMSPSGRTMALWLEFAISSVSP
ncbi:hypothetical protein Nmel_015337 [Mimus melanotis]